MPLLEQISLLSSPFLTEIILPFVLVFTIVFAILEKTELIGKKDINAIVALMFGLIVVGVPSIFGGVVVRLIPVISILVVILFTWFLVFGFVGQRIKTKWTEGLQKLFAIVLGVVILGIIAWAFGLFDYIALDKALAAQVAQFTVLLGAIIAVIAIVVAGAAKEGEEKEEEKGD